MPTTSATRSRDTTTRTRNVGETRPAPEPDRPYIDDDPNRERTDGRPYIDDNPN